MIEELNMTFVDGQTIINAEMLGAFQNKINELVRKANEGGGVPIGTDVFESKELVADGKYVSSSGGIWRLNDNTAYATYAVPIEPNVVYEVPTNASRPRFAVFSNDKINESNAIGTLYTSAGEFSTTNASAKYLIVSAEKTTIATIMIIKKQIIEPVPSGTDIFDASTQLMSESHYASAANGKVSLQASDTYNAYALPIEADATYYAKRDDVVDTNITRFSVVSVGNTDGADAVSELFSNVGQWIMPNYVGAKYLIISVAKENVPHIHIVKL